MVDLKITIGSLKQSIDSLVRLLTTVVAAQETHIERPRTSNTLPYLTSLDQFEDFLKKLEETEYRESLV